LKMKTGFLVAMLVGVSMSAWAQSGYVHQQGKILVDGTGKPLLLRGTSFGNWLEPEGYMLKLNGGPQAPGTIEALTRTMLGPEGAAQFWTTWRKDYITRGDVQFMKRAGFNSIRIPFHYKFFAMGAMKALR